MDRSKTLLEKIDFFQLIFGVHLLGLAIQPELEMVIPLHHPFQNGDLMLIILSAWAAYLCGRFFAKALLTNFHADRVEISTSVINRKVLFVLIVLQFLVVMLRYCTKGFPILSSDPGFAKGYFLEEPTYGCTRVLYILLPLSITIFFADVLKNGHCRRGVLAMIFLLGLIPLFAGLFKGAVIIFVGGLVLVYDKFRKRIRIKLNFRNIILAFLLAALPVMQYYFSEGEQDLSVSISYICQRLCVYSLEGFNFLYLAELEPNFIEQFRQCVGIDPYLFPPGYILSQEMLSSSDPNFTTVTTLYGFCWRNGGWISVVVGFWLLGNVIQILLAKIKTSENPFFVPLYIYLYTVFFKMLLVGEPFNDLRGPILSLTFACFVYFLFSQITERKSLTDENPVPRKSPL